MISLNSAELIFLNISHAHCLGNSEHDIGSMWIGTQLQSCTISQCSFTVSNALFLLNEVLYSRGSLCFTDISLPVTLSFSLPSGHEDELQVWWRLCSETWRDTEREWERKSVTDRNILTAGSEIRSSNATPLSMLCPILILKDSTYSAYCCYGYILSADH